MGNVEPWMIVAAPEHADSSSPVTASLTPGMRRTSLNSSPGRSRALDGMQA